MRANREIKHLLDDYTPYEFEHLVAKVWEKQGYRTWVTSKSSDGGLDVIAVGAGVKVGIQVKQNSPGNKVGSPTINEVFGAATSERCNKIVFVTTSSFTQPARKAARTLSRTIPVSLINGRQFTKQLGKHTTGGRQRRRLRDGASTGQSGGVSADAKARVEGGLIEGANTPDEGESSIIGLTVAIGWMWGMSLLSILFINAILELETGPLLFGWGWLELWLYPTLAFGALYTIAKIRN